jgi:hypothetical protein
LTIRHGRASEHASEGRAMRILAIRALSAGAQMAGTRPAMTVSQE